MRESVPALESAGVLWWCSGSSFIYHGEDQIHGLRGQRLYILIQDLADTVRAGEVLYKRLCMAGRGRFEISAAGSRMLLTATGNNASMDLDLGRRLIRIRIDPGVACPQAREFSFDPVDMALVTRLAIAHAVLVLVQAYQSAGSPILGRGDAGFADWNRLVRRVVLWVQAEGYAEAAGFEALGDPAHSVLEAASADDPDTEATRMMLLSLHDKFGGETFTAKEVYSDYSTGRGEVFEALHAILGRRDVTPISLGKVLANRRDRIVSGLVLKRAGDNRQGALWCIVPD